MTINDTPTLDQELGLSGAAPWMLADFLSTSRYWALFLSALLVALCGQGASLVFPIILMEAAASHLEIGIFHSAMGVGWVLGAFLGFVIAPRNGRSALTWPALAFVGMTLIVLSLPGLWSSAALLFTFGVACGAAQGAFPIALSVFLLAGRPSRIDFAAALLLLSTAALVANVAPIIVFPLYASAGGWTALATASGCTLLAVVVLSLARPFGFTDAPILRHHPLQPRRRSPFMVAAFLMAPPISIALLGLGFHLIEPLVADTTATMVIAALCFALSTVVHLGVWLYRIHGELAGAAPSQRLVTPLAAVLVAFLVPFGLPVLLLTLGDLLNDRAQGREKGRSISIPWLTLWTLVLPPVAVAMIQSTANDSYAGLLPEGDRR